VRGDYRSRWSWCPAPAWCWRSSPRTPPSSGTSGPGTTSRSRPWLGGLRWWIRAVS